MSDQLFIYGYLLSFIPETFPECELTIIKDNKHCIVGYKIGEIIPGENIYCIPPHPSEEDMGLSVDFHIPKLKSFFVNSKPKLWFINQT